MATITCDNCGAEMEFAPLYYREGDLEITCMRCGNCAAEFVAAVTDGALRDDIERYTLTLRMMAARKMPERFIRRAERLHARNVQRSKALRDAFLQA